MVSSSGWGRAQRGQILEKGFQTRPIQIQGSVHSVDFMNLEHPSRKSLQKMIFKFHHLVLLAALMATFFACEPSGGTHNTHMNQDPTLPFGLKLDPDPDFKGGFTIRESDGFALIGKGVSYRDLDLNVEALVGYGVQEAALAAEVIDDEGYTKFIKVVQQLSPSLQPFSVSWATEAEVKGNEAYEWVDLAEKK